jgi:hypothetical protein
MSVDVVEESVPTYHRRVGDSVFQGSNNSVLVLGTDRGSPGHSGLDAGLGHRGASGGGKGAGTFHVITGLSGKTGDPDFGKDLSYLYVSMKTDVDDNLGTGTVEAKSSAVPAIAMKSDAVRIVARKDVKVVIDGTKSYVFLSKDSCVVSLEGVGSIRMGDGKVVVDSDRIELGDGAAERIVKGDSFMNAIFNKHIHASNMGPTSTPVPEMTPEQLSSRTVFVK